MRPVRILALLLPAALSGCVERTLVIETDPPGAQIFLDETLVVDGEGRPAASPAEIPFVHYGTREVLVRREGYLSQKRLVTLAPPVYEVFPLDFFTELLIPYTFEDVHRVDFRLTPVPAATDASRGELMERAEAFRRELSKDVPEDE